MSTHPYVIQFSATARRQLESTLPRAVAVAAAALIFGDLADNPQRVGDALRPPLAPLRSARRGQYRILYLIEEDRHSVQIRTIEHRRDAYRRN